MRSKTHRATTGFILHTFLVATILGLALAVGLGGCGKKQEKQKTQLAPKTEEGTAETKPGQLTEIVTVKPEKRRALAIMNFENRSGDHELDWISRGVAEMLIIDLSQHPYLDVISEQRLFSILQEMDKENLRSIDEATATEIALRTDVEVLLMGDFTKIGETIRIDARLIDIFYGNLIKAEKMEGRGLESIFTMVDQLSRAIKEDLNLSMVKTEAGNNIMGLTTSSLDAYEAFIKGLEELHSSRFGEGMAHFEQAVEIDSNFAMAYAVLTNYWHGIGNIPKAKDAAIKAFALLDRLPEPERMAMEIHPHFAMARAVMLTYWHGIGNVSKAKDATRRAMDLLDRLPEPEKKMVLAIDAQFRDDYDEGMRLYNKLLELVPDEKILIIYLGLAQLYFGKGELEESKHIYKKILRLNQNLAAAHYMLGLIHFQQEKVDSTEIELQEALCLSPDITGAHLLLARIYSAQKRFDQAESHLQKAIETDPENPLIHNHLGYLYLNQKKYDQAIVEFKKCVALAPNDPNSYDSLAEGYFRKGDLQKAEREYFQALKLDPDFANSHYMLGRIYQQKGQTQKAIQKLEEYLRLRPEGLSADIARKRLKALRGG
jgi:tetratricopeptide (TPR) repeat protein